MRRDSWSSIEERGLPRAVIVSISIYARDPEKTWEGEPEVFVFRRWIPLPQVHESTQSEGQIATLGRHDQGAPDSSAPPGKNKAQGAKGRRRRRVRHGQGQTGDGANPFGAAAPESRPARGLAGQLVVHQPLQAALRSGLRHAGPQASWPASTAWSATRVNPLLTRPRGTTS